MSDAAFIKCLTKLSQTKDLTVKSSNEIILDAFPDIDFTTTTLLREITRLKTLDLKKSNFTKVFKLITQVYQLVYTNPITVDNYFSTDVRKIIHLRFPHVGGIESREYTEAKILVRIPHAVKGDILKQSKEKANKKAENVVEIDLSYITDNIRDNITSEDPMRRAFALLLASGCRPYELFHLSNFEALDHHWLKQDKVAKKKDRIVAVIKPIVYLTTSQFIDEVKRMRIDVLKRFPVLFETKETTVVVNGNTITKKEDSLLGSIENAANVIAKLVFRDGPEEGMTLYTTKSLYGAASYHIYGMTANLLGNNLTAARWGELIYGHNTVMHNYSHFKIS